MKYFDRQIVKVISGFHYKTKEDTDDLIKFFNEFFKNIQVHDHTFNLNKTVSITWSNGKTSVVPEGSYLMEREISKEEESRVHQSLSVYNAAEFSSKGLSERFIPIFSNDTIESAVKDRCGGDKEREADCMFGYYLALINGPIDA